MGDAYPFPGTTQITTQQEWEGFFAAIGSGVITGLAPSLNSGARQAVISAGRAIVQGFLKPVESSTGTAIPAASPQNRVDRLVLRLDRDAVTAADLVKPVVLTGTPGSSTPPALTRSTTGKWDLPIARWTSQANGALTGLVDEREWLGNRVRRCTSTSRPTSPQAGDIIYETDTGRWMGYTGSAWVVIYPVTSDSGEVAVPLATGFIPAGNNSVRRLNGVLYVEINAEYNPPPGPGGMSNEYLARSTINSSGRVVAILPSGYRPSRRKAITVGLRNGSGFCHLHFQTNGEVEMWHSSTNVYPGDFIRCNFSFVP